MSPKKKRKQARPRPSERSRSESVERPRREPLVVEEPSRWPVVLWIALTLVWGVGTPLFLLFVVAEGFAVLGAEEVTAQARHTMAGYLLGLLVCALVVPLAGSVTAALLRRRIAALLFAAVLVVSLLGMWVLASPWELVTTIWAGFRA